MSPLSDLPTWNRRSVRLLPFLLAVVLGLVMARTTWVLVAGDKVGARKVPSSAAAGERVGTPPVLGETLRVLQTFNPWETLPPKEGQPVKSEKPAEVAVASRLELELIGTMILPGDDSWAVLVRRGASGEQLALRKWGEVDGAILERIEREAVYFRNGGQLEEIRMKIHPEAKGGGSKSGSGTQTASDGSGSTPTLLSRERYQRMLQKGRAVLAGVDVSPFRQGGQLAGYQLKFREGSSELQVLGLSNGDVIQELDGIPVTDTQRLMPLAETLEKKDGFAIKLLRNGQARIIDIRIKN
ncbi:MAG: hypothetical protein HQL59_03975 [Magnetococcales bacterium]|nr:hypothetical protein [Magnetococcales bacterium]